MSEVLDIYAQSPKGEELLKAYKDGSLQTIQTAKLKSAIIDPYGVNGALGTRMKPSPIPYSTLRRMAKVPAVAAIINTRLNQVARFARRPRFEGDMGLKIILKDKDAKMDATQKKRAFEIEEFLMKTGSVPNARRKDNFDSFLRKMVRDTLTIDVMCWENVINLKGGLAEIWAVDGATIELIANEPVGDERSLPVYEPMTKRGMEDDGNLSYVQKIDGQTTAEYTEEELTFAIRNPCTDIMLVDFGRSELEDLIEIVTGIMNGVRYNTSYFSHSHLPQGVLELVGKYEDEDLEGFKRHWKTLTSGATGKWAVPVMGLQEGTGFKFTPFKNSNRDMEFNEFLEFLFNIACAVYQIDPNEVGFKSWTSGSGGAMRSDNTEVKIDQSKDKGFVPLMQFIANTINSQVIDRIDDTYALMWIGIDEEDEAQKLERDKTNLEMGKVTVSELRKRDDLEEILGEDGKPAKWTLAPANATLIQVYMADIEAAQASAQAGQEQQQQALAGAQGKLDSDDQHQKQLEVMDKQHQQGLEAKKVDQNHQMTMADKQAQLQGEQAKDQHGNQLKVMDKQHAQQKDLKNFEHDHASKDGEVAHKRGLETKKIDQNHQVKIEAMKQKAKDKPLKKSLDPSEEDLNEDLDITVAWAE